MTKVPFPRPRGIGGAIALFLASAGFAGRFPFAPGTVGSAVGCALWVLAGRPGTPVLAAAIVVGTVAAIWSADRSSALAGGKDPSWVVVDEVVGQWVALAVAPPTALLPLVLSFLLFRLFDIWKPFPARSLERLPGGIGIVADDLMAGLYAGIAALVIAGTGVITW
jgi:phosphatidylglycerophosphatase A